MKKIPYDDDIDKLVWMRHNLCFNIALTGKGFHDADLEQHFGDEPVWIVAEHVGYHLLFQMLGLEEFKSRTPDTIPEGFHTLTLRYRLDDVTFQTYRPKSPD